MTGLSRLAAPIRLIRVVRPSIRVIWGPGIHIPLPGCQNRLVHPTSSGIPGIKKNDRNLGIKPVWTATSFSQTRAVGSWDRPLKSIHPTHFFSLFGACCGQSPQKAGQKFSKSGISVHRIVHVPAIFLKKNLQVTAAAGFAPGLLKSAEKALFKMSEYQAESPTRLRNACWCKQKALRA